MQIKDMFRKKIDREIQGVIIVGQGEETNVAQELEEYVVTRELQRHFADFFAAYKKGIQGTTPKMGVWISGFFGSGKSHFLKILSYLLRIHRSETNMPSTTLSRIRRLPIRWCWQICSWQQTPHRT